MPTTPAISSTWLTYSANAHSMRVPSMVAARGALPTEGAASTGDLERSDVSEANWRETEPTGGGVERREVNDLSPAPHSGYATPLSETPTTFPYTPARLRRDSLPPPPALPQRLRVYLRRARDACRGRLDRVPRPFLPLQSLFLGVSLTYWDEPSYNSRAAQAKGLEVRTDPCEGAGVNRPFPPETSGESAVTAHGVLV